MPDDVSPLPPIAPEPAADPAPEPALDLGPGPGVNIGEEFGTAKRNLPPAKIVGIVLAAAAVLLGIFAFLDRAKPQGGGSVDNIAVAEIPNQNAVLVAVNVTLHNAGEKPLWIHDIKATLKTDAGEFSDVAASAIDYRSLLPGLSHAQGARARRAPAGNQNSGRGPGPGYSGSQLSGHAGWIRQAQVPERDHPALRPAPAGCINEIVTARLCVKLGACLI